MVRSAGLIAILLLGAACGDVTRASDGGPAQEDARHDAAIVIPDDAAVSDAPIADAPTITPPPPGQSRELVSGGRRMSGPTYTFDVQLGHAIEQSQMQGPTYTFEGNAAVKP
jgi:hypothetical protein